MGVPPGVVGVPPGVVAHIEALMTLSSRVTPPLRASTRPRTVAPVFSEMSERAMRLPWKAVVVPMVAELPTCQKTLHGDAPLTSCTELADAVVSVEAISNTNWAFGSPSASRRRAPVSWALEVNR